MALGGVGEGRGLRRAAEVSTVGADVWARGWAAEVSTLGGVGLAGRCMESVLGALKRERHDVSSRSLPSDSP